MQERQDISEPYKETRPWGGFTTFANNETVTVKILTINPGESFSLQYHHRRSEEWYIIAGSGMVEIGDAKHDVVVGQTFMIPIETNHRITASDTAVVVLEVARGVFDENDIVRLEDRYGRVA